MIRSKLALAAVCLAAAASSVVRADDQADVRTVSMAVITAIAEADHKTLDANFAGSPLDKKLADTMIDMVASAQALHTASVAKFGEAAAKANALDPQKMIEQVKTATIEITGDTAHLVGQGKAASAKDGMLLKKTNGTWKATSLTGEMKSTAIMLKIMTPMAAAMKETATEVEAGKYSTPAEVQAAMKEKVTTAMKASGVVPATKPAAPAK